MRIGGLASGMDIDSIVADLMKAERIPLDKLKQEKQTLEWKRDDYRSMNTLLLDFRSELTQYKLTSKYRARQTSSSDETKVTATATSGASQASYTINNVTKLASAANRVSGSSGANGEKLSSAGTKFDPKAGLYNQSSKFDNGTAFTWSEGVVETQTIKAASDTTTSSINLAGATLKDVDKMSVKVNGKSMEVVTSLPAEGLGSNQVMVDASGALTFGATVKKESSIQVDYITTDKTQTISTTDPVKDVQLAKGSIQNLTLTVNGKDYTLGATDTDGNTELKAADSSVIGTINKETGKISFATEQAAGSAISVKYTQNYSTFSLTTHGKDGQKNVNFLVQGNESLNTVMNRVNSSDAGVSMFYDSFSDRATMTRTETGNYNTSGDEITTSGDFLNSLLKFGTSTETGGTNVEFEINGLKTERYSNTFEMNGVTFSIKDLFDSSTSPNGVTTTISNNSTDVFDNIKGFVDKYNELIDKISKKTSEEFYRSYGPLTDEQRESLSDKQQEQWEEKAKSGLLKRDPILSGVLSEMRTDFYQPVDNASVNPLYKQLSSIGITTTSNYLEGGKLVINEAELKKAIEEDPQSVENLFRGGSDATNESQKGIIHRLYDSVNATMDKLKDKAGGANSTNQQFALGRELKNVDSSIDRFEDRMKQVEDRYWRQFTAMEKAIQQANQQSAYLMQQFSGM
ncbi:flagellar filament capping protein FliD [Rossellomorea vietnamensis]|uniref:flagellar filament capping protein FliD n=1 Tax=Rossellomorea vietnamensis TaxID=218284 RepID=UPI001CCD320B|nr:flagellar filament capping protein FliD [Rossellomorea vietnamensis]MCA0150558.1 flagellar filament capping protein FliD [Rossellomorea vietnamensis]